MKKLELAAKTGCAELKGMLLTDKALQESLAHLREQRVRKTKRSGEMLGVRTGEKAPEVETAEAITKPSTAQAKLLSSPTGTPLLTVRTGGEGSGGLAGVQSTILTEGSGSMVRFDLGKEGGGEEAEVEVSEAQREHAAFEKKMMANPERWTQEGEGLYSNPLSIYE